MNTSMTTAMLRLAAFVLAVGTLAPAYSAWPSNWLNTYDVDVGQLAHGDSVTDSTVLFRWNGDSAKALRARYSFKVPPHSRMAILVKCSDSGRFFMKYTSNQCTETSELDVPVTTGTGWKQIGTTYYTGTSADTITAEMYFSHLPATASGDWYAAPEICFLCSQALAEVKVEGQSGVSPGGSREFTFWARYGLETSWRRKTVDVADWTVTKGASFANFNSPGVLSVSPSAEGEVSFQATYTENGVGKVGTKTVKVIPPGTTYNVGFDPVGGRLDGANFGTKNGTAQTATVKVTYDRAAYNSGMRATKDDGSPFLGWWTAAPTGGSQIFDANGKYVPNCICWDANGKWKHLSNAMLYAHWGTPAPEPHNVKFDSGDGVFDSANFGSMNGKSGVATVKLTCGKGSYSAGMRAKRDGYTFQGWWTATTGGSMQYDANGKYVGGGRCWTSDGKWQHHGNAALYARWAEAVVPVECTVTFNSGAKGRFYAPNFGWRNGESGTATLTLTSGKGSYNAGMRAVCGWGDFTFAGWFTAETDGTKVYDANGKFVAGKYWTSGGVWQFKNDVALYAQWVKDKNMWHSCCRIEKRASEYCESEPFIVGREITSRDFAASAPWLTFQKVECAYISEGTYTVRLKFASAANTSGAFRMATIAGFIDDEKYAFHIVQEK